ncbi:thioredoxin family protein [Enterococcus sp. SMC-9]|uniref:thioredoxin family protein n=1 Tax=Enterococcus sp. SMC-9 TaxID=2862343 RepID=UPI001E2EA482|nr:thioredoxin family protein [Enterococcus sp. SMC-9]MCD1024055.1 thioredoxin family protein [Enterococcus sp. SMC-9]
MIQITDFNSGLQQLNQEKLAIAYISQPGCSVCVAVKPQLEARFAKDVPIYHFDGSKFPEVAGHFQALTAPLVVLLSHGKELTRSARFIDYSALTKIIAEFSDEKPDYAELFR